MKYSLAMKIKDLLPYKARVVLGKSSRRLRYAVLTLRSPAQTADKTCSVCDRRIRAFVHGGIVCPFCSSFPRHRALKPLVERWVDAARHRVKLMHVAPDACMRERLIENDCLNYLGIDRFTRGHYYHPDTIHGDIENLGLESDSQDLIICLHVLEHVENYRKALHEMYRVLSPGGIAVLAFPFRKGKPTYEDPKIVTPRERAAAFGQWDHLRVFGEDVSLRLTEVGFDAAKTTPSMIWTEEDIVRWGLLPDEIFFFCRKPGDVSSLSELRPA